MNRSSNNRIPSLILLLALFCLAGTVGRGASVRRIQLTDQDRSAIIRSVTRNIFKSESTYQGKYFILADGIRPRWIPRIAGYDLALITRQEIQSTNTPLYYYVLWLRPLKRSVYVTVHLYDSKTGTFPHVMLFYSYYRVGRKWRGLPRGGGGD